MNLRPTAAVDVDVGRGRLNNSLMNARPDLPDTPKGMTLVELMIVLVILSVLAAVAWPSYQNAVQRSRRADGIAALTRIMQAQERWRANHPQYSGTLSELIPDRTTSHDGHYTLGVAVEAEDPTAARSKYTATATVISTSPQASDTRCQVLRVRISDGNITYESLASGGTENSQPDPCWAR